MKDILTLQSEHKANIDLARLMMGNVQMAVEQLAQIDSNEPI